MAKYQVSECIGRGGMAEVFLARQEGIGGFEKLVALKRIYPHLIHDENFIEMFLAEARIAASLQHPKIVQILDIESDDDGLFIVMEYLAGEPLNYILKDLEECGGNMPPEIVCRIGSDIATGLHIAHTASDSDGQPRPVVHRDVTPSNIFVTFSGDVKVLDFGVAKAMKRTTTTDRGVLKGKTAYLSPELIAGDSVDGRADIFQLGIVVHEMLTGRRLFVGETVPEIIQAISESAVPAPSSVVPGLPRSLDEVVLKAMSRDPKDRYQTAEDFAQALDMEAASLGEPVSDRRLGKWMHANFPERVKQKLRLRQAALQPINDNTPVHIAEGSASVSQPTVRLGGDARADEKKSKVARPSKVATRSKLVGTILIALALLVVGYYAFGRTKPNLASTSPVADAQIATDASVAIAVADAKIAQTYRISISALPASATIELDGKIVATGEYSAIMDGADHELRLAAEGYVPQLFTISPLHPAPKVVRLQPLNTTERRPGKSEGPEKRDQPKEKPEEKPKEKPEEKQDKLPVHKTKPFGSDNLNPWELK